MSCRVCPSELTEWAEKLIVILWIKSYHCWKHSHIYVEMYKIVTKISKTFRFHQTNQSLYTNQSGSVRNVLYISFIIQNKPKYNTELFSKKRAIHRRSSRGIWQPYPGYPGRQEDWRTRSSSRPTVHRWCPSPVPATARQPSAVTSPSLPCPTNTKLTLTKHNTLWNGEWIYQSSTLSYFLISSIFNS